MQTLQLNTREPDAAVEDETVYEKIEIESDDEKKTFSEPDNSVRNVYRGDRNQFHRTERALVSKALIKLQLQNKENHTLAWCWKMRVAGSRVKGSHLGPHPY